MDRRRHHGLESHGEVFLQAATLEHCVPTDGVGELETRDRWIGAVKPVRAWFGCASEDQSGWGRVFLPCGQRFRTVQVHIGFARWLAHLHTDIHLAGETLCELVFAQLRLGPTDVYGIFAAVVNRQRIEAELEPPARALERAAE